MHIPRSFAVALLSCSVAFASDLNNGDSIAFLGDSITQFGWQQSCGYVRMCDAAFRENGIEINVIPAGISGHKSNNMLERLQRDVLDKKPTYMTLSCGVNDVWHGARGVELPQYKENITQIVDKAQAAGIKVVILTATMIREDASNNENTKLADYNEFLRTLAKEKGCPLVDLNAEMQKQVADFRAKTQNSHNVLTADGVHMDFLGNRMMAHRILREGFHFTDDEMAKADTALGNLSYDLRIASPHMTGSSYLKLYEKALAENLSPEEYINRYIKPEVLKAATAKLDELLK